MKTNEKWISRVVLSTLIVVALAVVARTQSTTYILHPGESIEIVCEELVAGTLIPPTNTPQPIPTATPIPSPPIWVSSTSQGIADTFQPYALPDDGLYGRQQNLDIITGFDGSKMLVFNSWADAQASVSLWAGAVDAVGYNPERGHTPPGEIADLAAVCSQAREFAHNNGVSFVLAPEMFFSDSQPELAQYADVYGLQVQRYQQDQARLDTIKNTMIPALRQAAPNVLLCVQVGVGDHYGGPAAALAAWEFLALDGLQLFAMPGEESNLIEILEALR